GGSLVALRQVAAERRLDFSIGGHVGRRDREPRLVLVDRAGLEVPGQGVDDIETERRPAGPWRADVAERGCSRRHDRRWERLIWRRDPLDQERLHLRKII